MRDRDKIRNKMSTKKYGKKYEKKDPISHILDRPDMYVGSVRPLEAEEYVYSSEFISLQNMEYAPALLRIFVEPLSNAIDNVERSKEAEMTCTSIKVDMNLKTGYITIFNNGDFIPIEKNKEGNYLHSMLFGELLTSSNYDDEELRLVSGRNGVGVTLCLGKGSLIPLFDGSIKRIEKIKIGEELIGDDGRPRKVLNKTEGEGKLYEIQQPRGNSYIVNENHILSLCMPDHKVIFWNKAKNRWLALYLDHEEKTIKQKSIGVSLPKIQCPECKAELCGNLPRHYKINHKGVEMPKIRASPTKEVEMTPEIKRAREKLENFLKEIPEDNTIDISLQDYLSIATTMRGRLSGFVGDCVQWLERKVGLDPYVLGIWLGDGYKHGRGFSINSEKDPAILTYLEEWGKGNDASFKQVENNPFYFSISSTTNKGKMYKAPLKKLLNQYCLINNKHIPKEYLVNSREVRLKILAGLIDSDGCVNSDGRRITIAQGMEHSGLASDIIFLVKSLGFMCSSHIKKTQWKYQGELRRGNAININISGKGVEDIPTQVLRKKCLPPLKRNVMNTGPINVRRVEDGEFVGLSVNGNQRFVLEDFTVTHNCNIYSTHFKVEGYDPAKKLLLAQEWRGNMRETDGPEIRPSKGAKIEKPTKGFTRVTYKADFARFGIKKYDQQIFSLFSKYVYDAAMLTRVKVTLNEEAIRLKSGLGDYSLLYADPEEKTDRLKFEHENSEIVITSSDSFEVISFVNGVYTSKGGAHVRCWTEAILRPIVKFYNDKSKNATITIKDVRQFFKLFVSVRVPNPEFEGQEKHTLVEPKVVPTDFPPAKVNILKRWDSTKRIEEIIRRKEFSALDKTTQTKRSKIPGLDHANKAGTKFSGECSLILCEGNSAKTYAVTGIEVGFGGKKGRDYWGVMPLRGKLLNVREKNPGMIAKNQVITNIIQAFGLKYNLDYSQDVHFKTLKYGRAMLLTDSVTADTPLLLKNENNLLELRTIDDISPNEDWQRDEFGKEINTAAFEIWTEKGWTKIVKVIRHKVEKEIYRVLTHTGCVDATEDHSLITSGGEEISPKDCKAGNKLLHSFPNFSNEKWDTEILNQLKVTELWKIAQKLKIQFYQAKKKDELLKEIKNIILYECISLHEKNFEITEGEAYVMGLFWADGTCGTYEWKHKYQPKNRPKEYTFNRKTYSWAIVNCNLDYLTKSLKVMSEIYPYEFKIIKCKTPLELIEKNPFRYKLIINGGEITRPIVEKYKELFYDQNKKKKIPLEILNSPRAVREEFYNGYYDGDGAKTVKNGKIVQIFDINGKLGAHGMYFLCRSLGYQVSVNTRADKPSVYRLTANKTNFQTDGVAIKKIVSLGRSEQYVYDLETENHHFQAGIGSLIVHNSDVDGIHISGLIMNVLHYLFPSLLERDPTFLASMQTPIVRVFFKSSQLVFYDEAAFKRYAQAQNKKLKVKYYKGLGSSNNKEIKETFGEKVLEYKDDKSTGRAMVKVFGKDTAVRKAWLTNYDPDKVGSCVGNDPGVDPISIAKYLNTELIKYSLDDCARSIPNLFDGLKQSQRKILYTCFQRKLNFNGKVLKVAQLSGSVAELSNYHHGEQNLYTTITKMAQAFVGSNNIPLLYRDGQFGCLDPKTPILLWDGNIKNAEDIAVGDKLVGDDGALRTVSQTTSGIDEMFKVTQSYGIEYIVNSQHILSLTFPEHKKISWKDSSKSWIMRYFNSSDSKLYQKTIRTNDFETPTTDHYNKSKITKEEAYEDIIKFRNTLPDQNIFDVKIQDYMDMPKTTQNSLKGFKNENVINWPTKPVPIDPYIFGHWIGDGNANGAGFATADPEIVKKWVIWADSIGAEITHGSNSKNHEYYQYRIRRRGSSERNRGGKGTNIHTAIGSTSHSSKTCHGCLTSSKNHPACDWIFENKLSSSVRIRGNSSNGMCRDDLNPWIQLLKKHNLFKNKHVPIEYLVNDENIRLQFLAGFIDSDGSVKTNGIIITQETEKHGRLLIQSQNIARSLGFRTNISVKSLGKRKDNSLMSQTDLWISGTTIDKIPTILPHKKIINSNRASITGLKITPIGKGSFCGWAVDGNERFLLADGTVTHNSRLEMGKDAASARYIFTKLDALTRLLFRPEDDVLLKNLEEDGEKIEPECYVPILPMILVNGSAGIGTGWSCNVPCFNPSDLIECIRIWLDNDGQGVVDFSDPKIKISLFPELTPWYRGFTGLIEEEGDHKFTSYGIISDASTGRISKKIVTELPVGMSTEKFKEHLEELEDKKGIKKFNNHSRPNKPYFEIIEKDDGIECTLHTLKLQTSLRTSNIVLFVGEGKLKKFESVDEVIDQFCNARYKLYADRKKHALADLKECLKWTTNKRRFLEEVMEDELILRRRKEEDIVSEMVERDYDKKLKKRKLELERASEESTEEEGGKDKGYDYLLTLPVRSFTKAMLAKLDKEIAELKAKIKALGGTTEKDLWLRDLAEFEAAYTKWLKTVEAEDESAKVKKNRVKKK